VKVFYLRVNNSTVSAYAGAVSSPLPFCPCSSFLDYVTHQLMLYQAMLHAICVSALRASLRLRTVLLPLPCVHVGHVFMLAMCSCWPCAHVGHVFMLAMCSCWPCVHVGLCSCWPCVHVGHVFMLAMCSCWPCVHVGLCSCWPCVHVGHVFCWSCSLYGACCALCCTLCCVCAGLTSQLMPRSRHYAKTCRYGCGRLLLSRLTYLPRIYD
jgi:hypothetical protein